MDERRLYQRISVKKRANGSDWSIELEGRHYQARLLDVSKGGARIHIEDWPDNILYGKTGTVKEDYYGYPYIKDMEFTVSWYVENVMGITFNEPLSPATEVLLEYYGHA